MIMGRGDDNERLVQVPPNAVMHQVSASVDKVDHLKRTSFTLGAKKIYSHSPNVSATTLMRLANTRGQIASSSGALEERGDWIKALSDERDTQDTLIMA